MCIITIDMSMIATRIGIADATALGRREYDWSCVFRGMLQGSARTEVPEVAAPAAGVGIGEAGANVGAPERRDMEVVEVRQGPREQTLAVGEFGSAGKESQGLSRIE